MKCLKVEVEIDYLLNASSTVHGYDELGPTDQRAHSFEEFVFFSITYCHLSSHYSTAGSIRNFIHGQNNFLRVARKLFKLVVASSMCQTCGGPSSLVKSNTRARTCH